MVRKNARLAFTLIELIFAIVIISIAVVSLPIMAKITEKGIESNILQEAIFAGSAELMGASSGYWDVNSMADSGLSHMSRVIDIGSVCENNTSSPSHRLRLGHIAQPYHRRCIDANITTISQANTADTNFPNLDNAVHALAPMFTDTVTEATGYKETYKSLVTIDATTADIKIITITVTSLQNGVDTNITRLSLWSANIGEIDYFKRRF